MAKDDGNKVGYGNPPVEKQFKVGQSGNPRGRPKRSVDLEGMIVEAGERLVSAAMGRGKHANLTGQEAMAHQLINQALNGNAAAIRRIFRIARRVEETQPLTIIVTGGPAELYYQMEPGEGQQHEEEP